MTNEQFPFLQISDMSMEDTWSMAKDAYPARWTRSDGTFWQLIPLAYDKENTFYSGRRHHTSPLMLAQLVENTYYGTHPVVHQEYQITKEALYKERKHSQWFIKALTSPQREEGKNASPIEEEEEKVSHEEKG